MKLKKVVDERQELEMLKVEHIGFWVMFWGLLVSIIWQSFFMEATLQQLGAEWIIFMAACVISMIGYVKKGQWDYYSEPSVKSYFLYSSATAVIFGVVFGISRYFKYEMCREQILTRLLPIAIIPSIFIFIITFIALAITGKMVQNKRAKLENEFDEE